MRSVIDAPRERLAYPLAPPELVIDEDISLTQFVNEDAEEIYGLVAGNRSHLAEFENWAATYALSECEKDLADYVEAVQAGRAAFYKVLYRGELVGSIYLRDRQDSAVALGYWLAKNAVGKGIATRAATYLVDYAFDAWGIDTVILCIKPDNARSQAVANRLGALKAVNTVNKTYEAWAILKDE
ncbi:MAG TPA: GNAT family protein [Candidatus Saccharimonadales bacterium]|nr:GNAT family protein [Candidatus Saccharimonadales bacterium]